jgi:hypothetical protein
MPVLKLLCPEFYEENERKLVDMRQQKSTAVTLNSKYGSNVKSPIKDGSN